MGSLKSKAKKKTEEKAYKRIFVMGPKGSGKSTLCKQLRSIYSLDFFYYSKEDRMEIEEQIYEYTIKQMTLCINCAPDSHPISERGQVSARFISMIARGHTCQGLNDALLLSGWLKKQTKQLSIAFPPELVMLFGKWPSKDCAHWMEVITAADCNMDDVMNGVRKNYKFSINKEFVNHISTLWLEDAIHYVVKHRSKYHIDDSAGYFFDKITRMIGNGFVPNEEDILRVPFADKKLDEISFEYKRLHFQILRVPHTETLRIPNLSKWMEFSNNVRVVIFMASLACYDDRESMLNSVKMFKDICASPWTAKSQVFLFLNKMDLLRDKLREIPLSESVPGYEDCVRYQMNKVTRWASAKGTENTLYLIILNAEAFGSKKLYMSMISMLPFSFDV